MARVLRVLLCVVCLRAAHAGAQGRVSSHTRTDRQHQHRRGGGDDSGALDCRPAVRPLRPAQDLYRFAGAGCHPRAGCGYGAELRSLPLLPSGDWCDWRELRHHAVPHVGHVRAQRGGHCQRGGSRLGQCGWWCGARDDATAADRHRDDGRHAKHGLAPRHGGAGCGHADRRGAVLALYARLPGRQLRRTARRGQDHRGWQKGWLGQLRHGRWQLPRVAAVRYLRRVLWRGDLHPQHRGHVLR